MTRSATARSSPGGLGTAASSRKRSRTSDTDADARSAPSGAVPRRVSGPVGVRRLLPLVVAFALVPQAPAPASAAGSPCRPQARSAVPAPLTAAQCVEASKIVAGDSTLAHLLSGRAHSVDRPDPWGSGDGVHNIGAVLKIHLRKPLDVTRIVLAVAVFPPGGGTYRADHLAVSLHGATGFWV